MDVIVITLKKQGVPRIVGAVPVRENVGTFDSTISLIQIVIEREASEYEMYFSYAGEVTLSDMIEFLVGLNNNDIRKKSVTTDSDNMRISAERSKEEGVDGTIEIYENEQVLVFTISTIRAENDNIMEDKEENDISIHCR